jgi:catechol 2,3-dioxygenase-like lactoylglutathione lyase family enzyme
MTSLAEIAVFTDDVAAACAFYRGLLGDPVTQWPGGTLFASG